LQNRNIKYDKTKYFLQTHGANASVPFIKKKEERRAEKVKIIFAEFLDLSCPKEGV